MARKSKLKKLFEEEHKEHPWASSKTVWRIVKDHVKKGHRGQITFVSLFVVLITFILYMTIGLPVMNDIIQQTLPSLLVNPTQWTQLTITVIEAFPLVLLIGIIITTLQQATPRERGI